MVTAQLKKLKRQYSPVESFQSLEAFKNLEVLKIDYKKSGNFSEVTNNLAYLTELQISNVDRLETKENFRK